MSMVYKVWDADGIATLIDELILQGFHVTISSRADLVIISW